MFDFCRVKQINDFSLCCVNLNPYILCTMLGKHRAALAIKLVSSYSTTGTFQLGSLTYIFISCIHQ